MPLSDYSQIVKQNQIDLVRRFNRVVTQRIGALDDAYLSRGRSLGLSRLLWEIEPAGSEVRPGVALSSAIMSISTARAEWHLRHTDGAARMDAQLAEHLDK